MQTLDQKGREVGTPEQIAVVRSAYGWAAGLRNRERAVSAPDRGPALEHGKGWPKLSRGEA